MSREQERFQRSRTDFLGALYSHLQSSTSSHAPYRNPGSELRNLGASSNTSSVNVAHVPIFAQSSYEQSLLNRNHSPSVNVDDEATGSKMQHSMSSASALQALRNYGPGIHSPTHFSPRKDFTSAEKYKLTNTLTNFSRNTQGSEAFYDDVCDSESSATVSDAVSCKPFNELNLRTVDEEDEFLYGDSNSMPEAPKSITEAAVKIKDAGHRVEWSDEDLFDEYADTSQNKPSPKSLKAASIWNIHNMKNTKSEQIRKISLEQFHSSKSPSAPITANVPRMGQKTVNLTNAINDNIPQDPAAKSKYHVAAQILKKQAVDKNISASRSTSNEKLDVFPDTCHEEEKWISKPAVFNKDTKSSDKEKLSTNVEPKSVKTSIKQQKTLPKAFNQKQLENIKNYIKKSDRKRVHPEGYEVASKYRRHESSSHLSPERHHSPHDFRFRSSHYHRSYEDYHKYSRDKYHYERYRRHSRSPGRKSRERSPGYHRYKDRSPASRHLRERSKSPYRSHESKYKKSSSKISSLDKSSKKDKDSDSSFCSLSFSGSDNSSDSSDSSEENDKSTFKSLPKTSVKDENKKADVIKVENVLNDLAKAVDTSFMSEDISKSFSDLNKPKNEEEELMNITKILENSKMLTEFYQQVMGESSTLMPSSAPVGNVEENLQAFSVSNSQVPVVSAPQSYSYPVMNPIPYPPPAVSGFTPTVPPPAFPVPPPMPSVASVYDSYPTPLPAVETKYAKKRPSTLRTIELGPSTTPLKTVELNPNTALRTIELVPNAALKPEESPELQGKEAVKPSTSVSSSAETNSDQKNALIEKYKKLKYHRQMAQCRVNNAVYDLNEMRNTLNETFGKKISGSERVIHSKCKNLVTVSSDEVNKYVKKAKHLNDELQKFKSRLPRELQVEVSKVKIEDYKEVNSTEQYIVTDTNKHHICNPCNKPLKTILNYLEHIQSSDHKKESASDNSWMKDFKKEKLPAEKKSGVYESVEVEVKGIEFLKPLTGFYCSLCKETILDNITAELHVKSHDHYVNYKNFIRNHPLYVRKCVFRNLIQCSLSMKQKKVKELDAKNQDLAELKKKDSAYQEKEIKVEKKLEEFNDDSDSSESEDQKSADKKKETVKSNELKTKTAPKFIYIGKAPNFRKPTSPKSKPKPWYKRESILSKSSDESNSTLPKPEIKPSKPENINVDCTDKSSDCTEGSEKSNKSNKTEALKSNNPDKIFPPKTDSSKKTSVPSVKYTCLTEEETKNHNVKASSENSENINKPTPSSVNTSEKPMPKSADSVVNQAIKNILLGADSSAHKDISLSDITLPKIVSTSSSQSTSQSGANNIPVPMDIDNSQDSKTMPNLGTEDLYMMGIRDDLNLKKLIIPIPPPSSMISYPNNVSNYLPSNVPHNFSVPPPTVFARNKPPPSYSNIHVQPVHPYLNAMPTSSFPNTGNAHMYPYSNPSMPPPGVPFQNSNMPPPYMQYSTANNPPPRPAFANQNNTFLSSNTSADLLQNKDNFSNNSGASNNIPVSISPPQSKLSVKKQIPESKSAGHNLITIVPDKNKPASAKNKLLSNSCNAKKGEESTEKKQSPLLENKKSEEKVTEIKNSQKQLNNNTTAEQKSESVVESPKLDSHDLKNCDNKEVEALKLKNVPETANGKEMEDNSTDITVPIKDQSGEKKIIVLNLKDDKKKSSLQNVPLKKSLEKDLVINTQAIETGVKLPIVCEKSSTEKNLDNVKENSVENESDIKVPTVCEASAIPSTTKQHTDINIESSTLEQCSKENQNMCESMDVEDQSICINMDAKTSLGNSSVEKSFEILKVNAQAGENDIKLPTTTQQQIDINTESSTHHNGAKGNQNICKSIASEEQRICTNVHARTSTENYSFIEKPLENNLKESMPVETFTELPEISEASATCLTTEQHSDVNLESSTLEQREDVKQSDQNDCESMDIEDQSICTNIDAKTSAEDSSVGKSLEYNLKENTQTTETASELPVICEASATCLTTEQQIDVNSGSSIPEKFEGANESDQNVSKSIDIEDQKICTNIDAKISAEDSSIGQSLKYNLKENTQTAKTASELSVICKASATCLTTEQQTDVNSGSSIPEKFEGANENDQNVSESIDIEDQKICTNVDAKISAEDSTIGKSLKYNLTENIQTAETASELPVISEASATCLTTEQQSDVNTGSLTFEKFEVTKEGDQNISEGMDIEDQRICTNADAKTSAKDSSIEKSLEYNLKEHTLTSKTATELPVIYEVSATCLTAKQQTDVNTVSSPLEHCGEPKKSDKDVCESMDIEDQEICVSIDPVISVEKISIEKPLENNSKENTAKTVVELPASSKTSVVPSTVDQVNITRESAFEQCQEVDVQEQNMCESMNIEDKKCSKNECVKASVEQSANNSSNLNATHSLLENDDILEKESTLSKLEIECERKNQTFFQSFTKTVNENKASNDENINTFEEDLNKLPKDNQNLLPSTDITEKISEMHPNLDSISKADEINTRSDCKSDNNVENVAQKKQSTLKEEQSNGKNDSNVELESRESSVLQQHQEVILQIQNMWENQDQSESLSMDVDVTEQSSNNSMSKNMEETGPEESKAGSPHILLKNETTYNEDASSSKLEILPSTSAERDISSDRTEVGINKSDFINAELMSKSSRLYTPFESKDNLIEKMESSTPVKDLDKTEQKKEPESCVPHENPLYNITSCQTFADISSSLAKLEKVVSEFSSRPELQGNVNKNDVSEALKLVSQAFKLATDFKQAENKMKGSSLLGSASQEVESKIENDSLTKLASIQAESKIENDSLPKPVSQESENRMEDGSLPKPGNSKNESDTDEYEENEQ